MILCAAENCLNKWFHLKCVNLYRFPAGEWHCEECKAETDIEREVCLCKASINDETITCKARKCKVSVFHKCCVKDIQNKNDWFCPDCK